MQPFSFFFVGYSLCGGGGGISGRVRALNLTVPLGSVRVGSDNLGHGPGSGPCRPLALFQAKSEMDVFHSVK